MLPDPTVYGLFCNLDPYCWSYGSRGDGGGVGHRGGGGGGDDDGRSIIVPYR